MFVTRRTYLKMIDTKEIENAKLLNEIRQLKYDLSWASIERDSERKEKEELERLDTWKRIGQTMGVL